MTLPDTVSRQVAELLSEHAGIHVRITGSEPVAEGWSARFGAWPWVMRCAIEGGAGGMPASVIVKVRRPGAHWRGNPGSLRNERAALEFLASIGSTAAPRLLAADDEVKTLVMEDLGAGPALEDLLVGSDPSAAERGLMAFAAALGRMHATTAGRAAEYYRLRSGLTPVDRAADRMSILGDGIERSWRRLRELVADRPYLPSPDGIDADVDETFRILGEPGRYLALSNGDTCPQNCRLSGGAVRFLDFEHAAYRHALLDAAALRFPFPACPCWSRLPADVGPRAEDAYRRELARSCPDSLDDAAYARGMTAACTAWTFKRAVRLPKLERADAPHPMRFSRRGQLLDIIGTTISCSHESDSLRSLAAWLADVRDVLRARWPDIAPVQAPYPAFGSARR